MLHYFNEYTDRLGVAPEHKAAMAQAMRLKPGATDGRGACLTREDQVTADIMSCVLALPDPMDKQAAGSAIQQALACTDVDPAVLNEYRLYNQIRQLIHIVHGVPEGKA